jgi:hypothetical protein
MIKFKVNHGQYGRCEVLETKILRETKGFYVMQYPRGREYRKAKVSPDYKYFDNKEQAFEFAVSELDAREKHAIEELLEITKARESALSELKQIKLDNLNEDGK